MLHYVDLSLSGFFGGLRDLNPIVLEGALHGTDIPIVSTDYRGLLPPMATFNYSNYFSARRTDESEIEVCNYMHLTAGLTIILPSRRMRWLSWFERLFVEGCGFEYHSSPLTTACIRIATSHKHCGLALMATIISQAMLRDSILVNHYFN